MTISRQNLSIIIVTYKSEDVIQDCIKSIPSDINILIVDNSGEQLFRKLKINIAMFLVFYHLKILEWALAII